MQTDIFEYFNGKDKKFGDPLLILERFSEQCGDAQELFALTQSENPLQAIPATRKVIEAARAAFKMVPFCEDTGAGATNEVVYSVLTSFFAWWSKKKSSTDTSPTSQPPTG